MTSDKLVFAWLLCYPTSPHDSKLSKIALSFALCNYLASFSCNYTQKHVITYTNIGCIQSVDWTTGLDYWTALSPGTCEIIEV